MKHFTDEDILALKKAEQEQPGGGLCGVFASLIVFILVAAVVAVILSISSKQPRMAVPTTSTPITGPTELVLANTPTLRPTVTTAVVVAPAIEAATAVPSAVPTVVAPTWTPAATYTPLPTYTAVPSQTPLPTHTPPATWTAVPTFTPYPTPLPFADVQNTAGQYSITNAALTRATYLVAALITFGLLALLISLRPSDRDLKRLQRLIEMHLMAALKPAAPVQALPAPVRTTPLAEWQRNRVAPVQNTGVTGVTGANTGAAPEIITVSVQPVEEVDTAVMQAICDLWNEIAEGGERPSLNRVCLEYFGAKNSDRLAIIRRAVKWGREQGIVAQVGEA